MFMKVLTLTTLHQGMDHHRHRNHKDTQGRGCHRHRGFITEGILLHHHLLDLRVIRGILMINILLHHHLSICTMMVVAIIVMTMDVLHF